MTSFADAWAPRERLPDSPRLPVYDELPRRRNITRDNAPARLRFRHPRDSRPPRRDAARETIARLQNVAPRRRRDRPSASARAGLRSRHRLRAARRELPETRTIDVDLRQQLSSAWARLPGRERTAFWHWPCTHSAPRRPPSMYRRIYLRSITVGVRAFSSSRVAFPTALA